MSILDQLLGEGPETHDVEVEAMDPDDWTVASTAVGVHQLMNNGLERELTQILGGVPSPDYGANATIDVTKSLQLAQDYETVLMSRVLNDQHEDLRAHDTADDVFSGGIKEGSKVLIQISNDPNKPATSQREVATEVLPSQGKVQNVIFDKFSVQSVTEPDQSRHQIVQTMGADLLYSFGRRPRQMRIIGRVMNGRINVHVGNSTKSMDWKNAFQRQYDERMRLSQIMKRKDGSRILIHAQDTIYWGYLLNMQSFVSADEQAVGQVTLTFLIAERSFPEQADHRIPGWPSGDEGGHVVSDKTVPEEMFPTSNVKYYLEKKANFDRLINKLKKDRDEKIKQAVKVMGKIGSPSGGVEGELKDKLRDPENSLESLRDDFIPYIKPISLHKIYENMSPAREIEFLSDNIPSKSNYASEKEFKQAKSRYRQRKSFLTNKVDSLNNLAREMIDLQIQIDTYKKRQDEIRG